MVSEGVDVPRLAVGVYATSVSTALFFAQAVGRFVRARRRGETASVFLPSVPVLLGFAAELEAERDHVVAHAQQDADPDAELAEANRMRNSPDADLPGRSFEALKASANFDRVLFDGAEFGTATEAGSPEEEDYLGLPGLLDPDQVALLLRKRQAAQLASRSGAPRAAPAPPASSSPSTSPTTSASWDDSAPFAPSSSATPAVASASAGDPDGAAAAARPVVSREALATLRKELNGLVGAWSHRTGQPHGVIHSELRKACGGPAIPQASAEQIQARIQMIRQWALSRG
jgi:hypothetical protein